MKHTVVAVLVAGVLALSAGGSTLAAGKLGGASGIDRFAISLSDGPQDDTGDVNEDRPTTLGGKVGGSLDRPAQLGAKLGVQGGDE